MAIYIGNAFSIQMLGGKSANMDIVKISKNDFDYYKNGSKSVVGHKDLADLLGVKCNRESITLKPRDTLVVAQVVGGRLPEGCKRLPKGVDIEFYTVNIVE